MKEDSLYFGVFLKVVDNLYQQTWALCKKMRKLKYNFVLNHLGKCDILILEEESTHSKVDAPKMVKCPYGHRLSCWQTG